MKELSNQETENVNGGVAFLALLPAVGKGVVAGVGLGTALFGLAFASAAHFNKR